MRRFACLLVSMAALLLLPQWLRAQSASASPQFLIGITGGYNFVTYTTNAFPILNSEPSFNIVQNGTGHGSYWGLSGELPLDTVMQNFAVVSLNYDLKSGQFGNEAIYPYVLSASLSYLTLNLGYKFNPWRKGLGIQACGSFGLILQKNFNRKESSDSFATSVSSTYVIDNAEAFRFAIRPELTYDISVATSWILTPAVGEDIPLTHVEPSRAWRASSFYLALSLFYIFKS